MEEKETRRRPRGVYERPCAVLPDLPLNPAARWRRLPHGGWWAASWGGSRIRDAALPSRAHGAYSTNPVTRQESGRRRRRSARGRGAGPGRLGAPRRVEVDLPGTRAHGHTGRAGGTSCSCSCSCSRALSFVDHMWINGEERLDSSLTDHRAADWERNRALVAIILRRIKLQREGPPKNSPAKVWTG